MCDRIPIARSAALFAWIRAGRRVPSPGLAAACTCAVAYLVGRGGHLIPRSLQRSRCIRHIAANASSWCSRKGASPLGLPSGPLARHCIGRRGSVLGTNGTRHNGVCLARTPSGAERSEGEFE